MIGANEPDEILGYLATLPDADPPEELLQRVRAATRPAGARGGRSNPVSRARLAARRHRRLLVATAASVFVLAGLAGSLHFLPDRGTTPAPVVSATPAPSHDPESVRAEIRALDRRLQRRLADDASDEELRPLWRERAVLAELLDGPGMPYHPTRI